MSRQKNMNGASSKSRHHILPKSRGGGCENSNIKVTTRKEHQAYNTLFGSNALPEEAVMILIKEWFYKEPDLRNRKLHQLVMELAKLTSDYIEGKVC